MKAGAFLPEKNRRPHFVTHQKKRNNKTGLMTIRPAAVAMKSNNRFNIANPEQEDEWGKRIA